MLSKILEASALPLANAKFVSDIAAGAATAAVVTILAEATGRHVLCRIVWSYSAAPTGGKLTITGEGTTLEFDITASGPGSLPLTYVGVKNTNVVVTLASGGGAVVGKVNVEYYTSR